jgi:glycerol uptake facilitator protein
MALRPLPICCFAEFFGTFLLVLLGCGSVHVAVLTGDLTGLWQVGIVWGIAIMGAIYGVGAVSGAHINPAITVGMAAWRMFPAGRVIPYIVAQVAGAFAAAAVLYALFAPYLAAHEAAKGVKRGEPGSEITAMCYCEFFPNPGAVGSGPGPVTSESISARYPLVSEFTACLAEFIGTLVLGFVVAAVTNDASLLGPKRMAPLFIGLTVAGLICVIAPLTQACFNPARDFGPRLFAALAGWGDVALPGLRSSTGFLTVYILSPLAGAVTGIGMYQTLRQHSLAHGEAPAN